MKSSELRQVDPSPPASGEGAAFAARLVDRRLILDYRVTTAFLTPARAPPATLWEGNVVELFLSVQAGPAGLPAARWPYFEFEVSPYGERCLVKVNGDGAANRDFAWAMRGFEHSVAPRPDRPGWDAEMRVDLAELGWGGDPAHLRGNAFAILGATTNNRRFYALNLPAQAVPHFHLPEHFVRLA